MYERYTEYPEFEIVTDYAAESRGHRLRVAPKSVQQMESEGREQQLAGGTGLRMSRKVLNEDDFRGVLSVLLPYGERRQLTRISLREYATTVFDTMQAPLYPIRDESLVSHEDYLRDRYPAFYEPLQPVIVKGLEPLGDEDGRPFLGIVFGKPYLADDRKRVIDTLGARSNDGREGQSKKHTPHVSVAKHIHNEDGLVHKLIRELTPVLPKHVLFGAAELTRRTVATLPGGDARYRYAAGRAGGLVVPRS